MIYGDSRTTYFDGICRALIMLGRAFVFDLGLSGLFDRFERTFGSRLTNLLLALIGVTIVVFCLSFLFSAISPVVDWLTDDRLGGVYTTKASAVISLIVTVLIVALTMGFISDAIERRQKIRLADEIISRTSEHLEEVKKFRAESKALLTEIQEKAIALQADVNKNIEIANELKAAQDAKDHGK